ncbi:oligopeptide ABC transporter permease OppC [Spiroplasma alleghenense]|uniref:Oligopeptide ABC transporter permease n=1 Tax=Spiroplasma alleghenense TaxID=216931 RepID=A0A345Z4F9_9MOLU|nr:oligopeptide ABC transporter permease OppC [Spiroplasma alleghenense]AXK51488.1 oligopeptide ABC transporter permease [Spiroplasma alleghenense]
MQDQKNENNLNNDFDIEKIDKDLFQIVGPQNEENERITTKPYSYWKTVGSILCKNWIFLVCTAVLLIIVLLAAIVPIGKIAVPKPGDITWDITQKNPSWDHLFGLGIQGEDFWNKIWIGTRTTLIFAVTISVIQIILGVVIGSIWGYYRRLDILFIEITRFISLVPTLILWLIIIFAFGQSWGVIVFAVSIVSWIGMAEIIRVQIILVKNTEYNIASRTLATPGYKIIGRNIMPKILPIVIQTASFSIPGAIAIDSTLNYFNFGFIVGRENTSLGYILNEVLASSAWQDFPHLIIIPVAMIAGISIIVFLVGRVFADSLDPKNHR